jgi:hypothetical protein
MKFSLLRINPKDYFSMVTFCNKLFPPFSSMFLLEEFRRKNSLLDINPKDDFSMATFCNKLFTIIFSKDVFLHVPPGGIQEEK